MPVVGCALLQAIDELEERALALADGDGVDVRVVREHLAGQGGGVGPADDHVRAPAAGA